MCSRSVHQPIGLNVANHDSGPQTNRISDDRAIGVALHSGREINGYAAREKWATAGSSRTDVPAGNGDASGLYANAVLGVKHEIADFRRGIQRTRSNFDRGLGRFVASATNAGQCAGQHHSHGEDRTRTTTTRDGRTIRFHETPKESFWTRLERSGLNQGGC
jgi:hypothetical protein